VTDHREVLERIAAALERIAPAGHKPPDWSAAPAFVWSGGVARALASLEALPLEKLRGIDAQKAALGQNLKRLATGAAAHDTLLWGARGMGKSALVRSVVADLQEKGHPIALIQAMDTDLASFSMLFDALGQEQRSFVIFVDDLGFGEGDQRKNLALRSLLEGGAAARPSNIRFAVTSNRRAIVQREPGGPEPLHERDERDNALALADRFGLTLAFHPCDQATYFEMVRAYTDPLALDVDETEANAWAIARGNRSGRVAYQFACELAGRAGLAL
jgi:predicted AAA+ superfamily ATPase